MDGRKSSCRIILTSNDTRALCFPSTSTSIFAMASAYWSVDAFLSENTRLPCTFLLEVPNLGHLEGATDRDIKQGTTVELPYWLGINLASVPDRDYLSISLPKPYTSRVRNALSASARSVNLRNLGGAGGWFFACGVRLEESIDDPNLKEVLHRAFRLRLPEVMDHSQHASATANTGPGSSVGHIDQQAAAFLAGLDEWEKELFNAGENGSRAMKVWTEAKRNKHTKYGKSGR